MTLVGGPNLGSFEAAKPPLLEAVETLEAELGPEHLRVAGALKSPGSLYTYEADYERAQMSLERALTIYQASEGVDRFDLASVLHMQGELLLDQARFEEAGYKLRTALEIYEEVSAETLDQPLFGELPGRRERRLASVLSSLGHPARYVLL